LAQSAPDTGGLAGRINWLNNHLFEELKVLIMRVREVYGI